MACRRLQSVHHIETEMASSPMYLASSTSLLSCQRFLLHYYCLLQKRPRCRGAAQGFMQPGRFYSLVTVGVTCRTVNAADQCVYIKYILRVKLGHCSDNKYVEPFNLSDIGFFRKDHTINRTLRIIIVILIGSYLATPFV